MGYKNKKYSKSLHQQMYDTLVGMQAFGESRREAKKNGTDRNKIFSFKTFQVYKEHCQYFIRFIKSNHPECKNLRQARKYIREWLQTRVDQGLSAWTISTEMSALSKLYGIHPGDPDYFTCPKRCRENIKRSRDGGKRRFSEKNNAELVAFCKSCGTRRSELLKLKGKDLITIEYITKEAHRLTELSKYRALSKSESADLRLYKDAMLFTGSQYFINIRRSKGGRDRISPLIGPDIDRVVTRFREIAPDEKVWLSVSSNADIHHYRSDYCTKLYRMIARPIENIPYNRTSRSGKRYQGDVVFCRRDERGRKLDRNALLLCSKALGHNRISVVSEHYLRGI